MQDKLQKALGKRIRQFRLRRGYSQETFADHCGVHRTFMGTIERGETNLSLQNLARVAAGLGITLSKLFSGLEHVASGLGDDGAQTNAPPSRSNSSRRRA